MAFKRERLRALAVELCDPDPGRFGAWLRRLILETLGEAMLQACIAALFKIDPYYVQKGVKSGCFKSSVPVKLETAPARP